MSRKEPSGIFWNVKMQGDGRRIRTIEANKNELFKELSMVSSSKTMKKCRR